MSLLGLFFMVTGATRAGYEGIKERSIEDKNAREARRKKAIARPISSTYLNCYYLKGYGKVFREGNSFYRYGSGDHCFSLDNEIRKRQEAVFKREAKKMGLKGYLSMQVPYKPNIHYSKCLVNRDFENNKRYFIRDGFFHNNLEDKPENSEWDGRLVLTDEVKKEVIKIYEDGMNFIFDEYEEDEE